MNSFKGHIAVSLLVAISGSVSFAQNYSSVFGVSTTKWEMPFCNLDQAHVKTQVSEMETMINGTSYKMVGTVHTSGVSYDLTGVDANGFAREDVQDGKVWFMSTIETIWGLDTLEFLVMDLSLNVNDTFLIHQAYNEVITSFVDSVYYVSGVKHVRTNYYFWGNNEPLTFIEGIGTNYGLGYMHDSYNMCRCLISINKDFDEVYLNSSCFPPSVGYNDLHDELELTVYPNPTSSILTIETNRNEQLEYQIISLNGKIVRKDTLSSLRNELDLSDLSPDIYVLRIGNESFKLVITK